MVLLDSCTRPWWGSGIPIAQTYDINITGDIIADDSKTPLDTSLFLLMK